MNPIQRVVITVLFLVGFCLAATYDRKKLIFIVLGGFRYDYVQNQSPDLLPGFSQFLRRGVKADYLMPGFPTLGYPQWTTLATGLHSESHGIIGNYFYDYDDRSEFAIYDADKTGNRKWWTAEPIWTTATKAGLKVAVINWSRCDIIFGGSSIGHCEYYIPSRGQETFRSNIEKVVYKLEEGYDFIQLYYEYPDILGQEKGPDSEEIKQEVRRIDKIIGYLQDRIEQMGRTNDVNIVIVSDHGMASLAPGLVKRVELDEYLLADNVEHIADAGAFSNIKVRQGYMDQVYNKLRTMPGVSVYLRDRDEIPGQYHFHYSRYIHDIILVANLDTWIMKSRSRKQIPSRNDNFPVGFGARGYSPEQRSMRGIFYAKGPDFLFNNETIPPVNTVDIYPLLTSLLRVTPQPHNGTVYVIRRALRDPDRASNPASTIIATKALLWSTMGTFILHLFN